MPVTLLKSLWTSGNLAFRQTSTTGDAAVHFGVDDVGVDVKFFGATSGSYMLWDQSANALTFSAATLNMGVGGLDFPSNITAGAGVFDIDGTASYFVDFAATAKGGITLTANGMSQSPETASEDGFIAIKVGASIYEIPVYLRT